MDYYAPIDVSLEWSSVCIVDGTGKIVAEAKVMSEPEALIGWLRAQPFTLSRIGLEAGPLSQWLFASLEADGLAAELLETRHVRTAFKTMPVKTDKKDARGIAQLMRLGWFKPVHCKSLAAQETRALLTARKLLQTKRHDVEMSVRGVLRGFGLKVGPADHHLGVVRVAPLDVGDAVQTGAGGALHALFARQHGYAGLRSPVHFSTSLPASIAAPPRTPSLSHSTSTRSSSKARVASTNAGNGMPRAISKRYSSSPGRWCSV
jgi:transposase